MTTTNKQTNKQTTKQNVHVIEHNVQSLWSKQDQKKKPQSVGEKCKVDASFEGIALFFSPGKEREKTSAIIATVNGKKTKKPTSVFMSLQKQHKPTPPLPDAAGIEAGFLLFPLDSCCCFFLPKCFTTSPQFSNSVLTVGRTLTTINQPPVESTEGY